VDGDEQRTGYDVETGTIGRCSKADENSERTPDDLLSGYPPLPLAQIQYSSYAHVLFLELLAQYIIIAPQPNPLTSSTGLVQMYNISDSVWGPGRRKKPQLEK
jgi:hypothetical protein